MPRRYSPEEVIKVLSSLGWVIVRQRGSHVRMQRRDGARPTTIRVGGRQGPVGTFKSILAQTGLKRQEFEDRASEVL